MSDPHDEAQFRRHLSELRSATSGLGHDFAHEFTDLDEKIERFGRATGQEAVYLASDIKSGLGSLGRSIDEEVSRIPGRIASGGRAIGAGTVRAAEAARDAVLLAAKRTRDGTKNALAAAAGVKRTPIRSWSPPGGDAGTGPETR